MTSPELIMDEFREAKTKLKLYTVENNFEKPEYETVSKREENYRKIYKVRVIIEGLVDTTGEGYSRRLAEHRAAINALNEIKEVREEQKKSKAEELAKDKSSQNNSDQNNEEVVTNGINGDKQSSTEDIQSDKQINGNHNISNNSENMNNENEKTSTKSITINADINTSAEEVKDTEPKVNGHNREYQSQSSSDSSTDNQINGENNHKLNEIIDKNIENSIPIKIYQNNGQNIGGPTTTTNRTFQPFSKSAVQKLQDFCMKKQSAFPFYDTTYRDQTFRIKCRIEFNEDEEKREFYGTGSGNTSKEAKIKAAEDVIQQLTELNLM